MSKLRKYGSFAEVNGELDKLDPHEVEEAKETLMKAAEQELGQKGIQLNREHVEWIIRQAYTSSFGLVPEKLTSESKPVVTVGWTYMVNV
jgi:hypothetical protein